MQCPRRVPFECLYPRRPESHAAPASNKVVKPTSLLLTISNAVEDYYAVHHNILLRFRLLAHDHLSDTRARVTQLYMRPDQELHMLACLIIKP